MRDIFSLTEVGEGSHSEEVPGSGWGSIWKSRGRETHLRKRTKSWIQITIALQDFNVFTHIFKRNEAIL